jgi:hypothetical protein
MLFKEQELVLVDKINGINGYHYDYLLFIILKYIN